MNVEDYAGLYHNSGLNIKQREGYYFNRQGFVNYTFPNLARVPVNGNMIRSIRWKYPLSVLLTELPRKNTYEFILDTLDYSIEKFSKKTRNRVRKSLNNCTFKQPELADMLTDGLFINQQTLQRQKRRDKTLTNAGQWNKYIRSLYSQDCFIFLGAYYAGRMVGYVVAVDLGDRYDMCHAFIDREDSAVTNAMNGLLYILVNQIIEKKGYVKISYGIDSFTELSELNRFKNNMLFERNPVSRVYVIHPFLLPFVRLIIFYHLHLMGRKNVKSLFVRKLIRLYQGHRLYYRDNHSA